jgi:diguanylate cyclase
VPRSARERIAGESKASRWDRARVSLVMPIGVIVAVAIICVVVAVLTSAQRADEVSFDHEQQLIRQAVADHGERVLHELDSVAGTPRAAVAIRAAYNPQWTDRHVGVWLQTYFEHDVVVVVDGSDQIKYSRWRSAGAAPAGDLRPDLGASLDLLRARLNVLPKRTIEVDTGQHASRPPRRAALVQLFLGRPAIVAAVAVGTDADLASGNERAPVVISVKYIDAGMLREIGTDLQLSGLH